MGLPERKLKSLFSFVDVDKEHLFKGRLQLFKSDEKIDIQVKNNVIGTVSSQTLKEALSKLE